MQSAAYDEYRDQLFDRHQHPLTSGLSTLGDLLPVLGLALAALRRDRRWASAGLVAGLASAVIAHLFQPGTLKPELKAILRHPVWAARAERERNMQLLSSVRA